MLQTKKEPKNLDFFTRVAPFIPWVAGGGMVFHALSAITEAFGIYQFGSVLTNLVWVVIGFAALIVIGWELIIKSTTNYITKSLVMAARGEATLEKLEAVLIAIALIMGGALITYSYKVSKENSYKTFQFLMPDADTTATTNIVFAQSQQVNDLSDPYDTRKSEIEKRYADQIRAARKVYEAEKAKGNQKIAEWKEKEKRYNKQYPTYINNNKESINNALAKFRKQEAALIEKQSEELAALDAWRDGRESTVIAESTENIGAEKNKRALFVAWFQKYSHIWAELAGLAVILAVLCNVFVAIFEVLAGIEKESHILPEHYDSPLLDEAAYLIQLTFINPVRNAIRNRINQVQSNRVQLEVIKPTEQSVVTVEGNRITTPVRAQNTTPSGRSIVKPFQRFQQDQISTGPQSVVKPVENRSTTAPVEPVQRALSTPIVRNLGVEKPVEISTGRNDKKSVEKSVEIQRKIKAEKPLKKTVENTGPKVLKILPDVVEIRNGEKVEVLKKEQVQRRKSANYYNAKNKRKTKASKNRANAMGDFYASLEKQMNDAQ